MVLFVLETDSLAHTSLHPQVEIVPFSLHLLQKMPIHALRYFLYEGFLKKNPLSNAIVMMTDVRDVIFQRDPFDFDYPHLSLFLEETKIGECRFNRQWIESRYGLEEAQALANCQVSCSGITIGPIAEILTYLGLMKKNLMPPLPFIGYDQGVHNYLLHHQQLSDALLFSNSKGPVMTMQYQKTWKTVDGKVAHEDGSIIHVLHQYDRHFSYDDYLHGKCRS